MSYIRGRYSWLIRPILVVFDLVVILGFSIFLFYNKSLLIFCIYIITLWLLSAYSIKFYNVYRYTKAINIAVLLVKQFFVFFVLVFAFVGFYRTIPINTLIIIKYGLVCTVFISFFKFLVYYGLKQYRQLLDGNRRLVIIIGDTKGARELKRFFTKRKEYGYKVLGTYSNKQDSYSNGSLKDALQLISTNTEIDEIYCAMGELSENNINTFVKHADENRCNIKFIPQNTNILNKHLKADFYNYLPVLSIQDVALNNPVNQFVKRLFDVVLSILVIVFILSWLSVILYILIRLESKGPLIYKHQRNGINYKEFTCYKFRSLYSNSDNSKKYVEREDERVTKIGRFLRRTSLDELPQFVNVLKGDMSVVGPRPHIPSYTEAYSKKTDTYNFIFRHNVKPGITGLAQTKGFRGEIKSDEDIVNRVKYDIFYIENWSLLLDIQIILKTIFLILKGDEKAY